jgi:3'-phosphoadenosine 5'-phosphosulfate sulfotransferase (PAPS reductase)/FAD synthetase
MHRVVFYSGGALSWAAAMRTIERHGRDNLTLLFTDTRMEDEDLYRFLDDSERQMGVPITRVVEGRTPWEVFRDRRFLANTRIDTCSEMLKRKPGQAWLRDHAPGATLVFGIDWEEQHRLVGLTKRYGEMGHAVEAPMCDSPWKTKPDVLSWMRSEGLEPPRLYDMGFAHNNCGGFCVRAGQAHFATLFREMPDRYRWHEQQEQDLRAYLDKDIAILRDRTGGKTRPMTLKEFRERLEAKMQYDDLDLGGCACFVQDAVELV